MDIALLRSIMMALPDLESINAEKIKALWNACDRFFEWERRMMLEADPSEQDRIDHKTVLRWLMTIVKLAAKAHRGNQDLELILNRLDGSRGMFQSAMSIDEADAILAKAFPQ
jgi:hypothetical protein